ncbi:Serine/threonine protein kinase [Labilithrix luteola]|uniref:Serine/threonine protein kinase n=1 Tax=Labilithrix luteola TaxID=1391654 RepID=A0A0K1PLE8_9BACT|nr:serine/threonine-protein kinase [Labilithrix luteola]AKU94358.1 Serine/threonine protein kinase [Labilithrix luteola]
MTGATPPQTDLGGSLVGAPVGALVGAILCKKYTLKRLIGTGSMGSVYEAYSAEGGRPLAVKLLAVDYLHDEEIKSRFLAEGQVCQRLIHPNIVRVEAIDTAEDGTPFIVMELLEGVPLSAYTRAGVRVPMQQAATILQGILAGLSAAHAQGIVHRDLKPENVFLAREANGAFSAKLLDFGIAKVMDVAGGMGSKTRTGVLLGTPAYMSPEQIKNSKDVDARTDLWSAGVMFYEMLTGRVAFPAPTEYARLAAVTNTTPPPIDTIDPQLARFSAFVQLAMQKDRAQRYQTGLEMARALAAAAGAGADPATHAAPGMPLSRLPDVPSMWMPQKGGIPSSNNPVTMEPAGAPATTAAVAAPAAENVGPSGTLASRAGRPVTDPPVKIAVVGASAGTLPSENLPMFSASGTPKRGVAPVLVAVFVLLALCVGFFLGWTAARLH